MYSLWEVWLIEGKKSHLYQFQFFINPFISYMWFLITYGHRQPMIFIFLFKNKCDQTRYHYMPVRMTKIQNPEHWMPARMWSYQELSFTAAGNAKCCSHIARQFGGFLHNCTCSHRKIRRPCSLAFIPRRWTYVHTETCTRVFIATLLVIAETWKQLRCSSLGEWMKTGPSGQWDVIQH